MGASGKPGAVHPVEVGVVIRQSVELADVAIDRGPLVVWGHLTRQQSDNAVGTVAFLVLYRVGF
ncbi:hypothetical protein RUR49_01885 [Pseudoxanthobacter sp. M-2]|uniref:hypothetical protein n=1 Tax=Pseudoxanthobacter sp. M-2 TaxID=3078754 RepID=UPI0038FCBACB